MKNVFLTFILALAFVSLSANTPNNPGGSCGNNLTWSFDASTGTLSITGTGDMTDYIYFGSAPWYAHRLNITSLSLSGELTSIGNFAFHELSLLSVAIPNSVTRIGNYAFSNCIHLPSVTISASVTSLGSHVFSGCSALTLIDVEATNSNYLSSDGIVFNKTKTELIQYPAGKTSDYTIPVSVETLAEGAFSNCDSLRSINIGNSIKTIGNGAFEYCDSLKSVTVGSSVETIGNSAFYSCTGLTSVVIPNSVTSLGNAAFEKCHSLTSVTIPASVTSIGSTAFLHCTDLSSINVEATNPNYSSLNGVLFNKTQTELIQYPGGKAGDYTIPNSVTDIGNYAITDCTGLTSIRLSALIEHIGYDFLGSCSVLTSIETDATNPHYSSLNGVLFDKNQDLLIRYPQGRSGHYTIPGSVTILGGYAFCDCTGLTSVTIPNSVITIRDQVFGNCSGLTSVTIPNSVITIGHGTFYSCRNLTSVTLGALVANIEYNAFLYCDALTSLTSLASVPPTLDNGVNLFYEGIDPAIPVYVPCGSEEAYRNASGWSYLTNIQCVNNTSAATIQVNRLLLYPNPVATKLRIKHPEIKAGETLLITDVSGRVVKTYTVRTSADDEITVDVSSLPQGVYLLKAGADTERFVKK